MLTIVLLAAAVGALTAYIAGGLVMAARRLLTYLTRGDRGTA
jgi:hypothetical protein